MPNPNISKPTRTKNPMIMAGTTIGPRFPGPATTGTSSEVKCTSLPTKSGPRKATTKMLVKASQIEPKIIAATEFFIGCVLLAFTAKSLFSDPIC